MSVVGFWQFRNKIELPSNYVSSGYSVKFEVNAICDSVPYEIKSIEFGRFTSSMDTMRFSGTVSTDVYTFDTEEWNRVGDILLYQEIQILSEPTDKDFVAWLESNAIYISDNKIPTRLYLGDVVKTFGTKQLRKLTKEKPQDDSSCVGTWLIKEHPEGGQFYARYLIDGYFYVYDRTGEFPDYEYQITQCPIHHIAFNVGGTSYPIFVEMEAAPYYYADEDEYRYKATGYGPLGWSGGNNVWFSSVNEWNTPNPDPGGVIGTSSAFYEIGRTIIINSEPRYEYFKAWLRANAEKIS